MTTLSALLYADGRAFVNQAREIRRSPARALLWLFFAVSIGALIALRVVRATSHTGTRVSLAPGTFATDAIVCVTAMLFGFMLVSGNRYAGLFAHPAEARFIIDSPATPFVATLYVQLRQIVLGSARQAFGLLYLAIVYLPATLPVAALVRDLILIVVAFIFIAAVPLARQLLPLRLVPFARAAGALAFVAALVAGLRDIAQLLVASPAAAFTLARVPAWHPGRILLAGADVQFAAIAVLLLCAAALFTGVARRAGDTYPELYELSMKRIQRTERLRGGLPSTMIAAPKGPAHSESMTAGAPPGVGIFVWRAWTEYRRTNGVRSTALETGLFLVLGYALARLTTVADPDILVAFASPVVNIAFILAVIRAASLTTELRRPLFWLSGATLFQRLGALAVAQGWRLIGWSVLIAIGLGTGGAPVALVLAAASAAPATVLLAGAIGYASYALLPYDVDQRGPMRLLRLLLGYVLVVPPVAAGIATGAVGGDAVGAVICASFTTLLEAAVLIAFAARRLDRMSISLR